MRNIQINTLDTLQILFYTHIIKINTYLDTLIDTQEIPFGTPNIQNNTLDVFLDIVRNPFILTTFRSIP
jgi:hypothetical protein